jgi:hypothetical protein
MLLINPLYQESTSLLTNVPLGSITFSSKFLLHFLALIYMLTMLNSLPKCSHLHMIHSTRWVPVLDSLGVLLDLISSIMVLPNSVNNVPRSSFLIPCSGVVSTGEVLATFGAWYPIAGELCKINWAAS